MSRASFLLTLLAATASATCADLGPRDDGLAREIAGNRRLWESVRPAAYVYEVERQCFCIREAIGPVRVAVAGGQVRARTYSGDGSPVRDDLRSLFPAAEGLFDILEEAVAQGAHQVQVTWDPATGLPLDFWIDYNVNMADEEQGYRIVALPSAGG